MIAIGCLAPLIFGVIGGLAGNAVAGPDMAPWGAGLGFAVGLVFLAAVMWLMGKARS